MTKPASYRSPWRTAEHDDLATIARTFFNREVLPNEEKYRAQGHPDLQMYLRAGERGLLGLHIPAELGGGGATFAHDLVVFEEQVACGERALGLGVHSGIVMGYLLAYGSQEQRRRWLPRMCSGELVGAIAMTEPGGGSDLQALRTRADRVADDEGGGYRVTGSKTFITNGYLANLVILAVKTDPAARASGISLLVCEVDDDTPGFRRGRMLHKIGLEANDTAELFFDGMRVPADCLLGDGEGRGFAQMMAQLPAERLVIAASAVAAMERALDLTIAYTKERTAFGKTLFEQQNTRFTLAECAAMARTGRVFLDYCIQLHLDGALDVATAAMAKFSLTDAQCTVIDRCLQLFGGYGYSLEFPIARMYADARVSKIYAGANEIMKERGEVAVTRYVVLLRGINLAKARRVAMADLRLLLADIGCTDVRTHLNSGNAVVTSTRTEPALVKAVEKAIKDRLGQTIPVMVRSREDFVSAIEENPLKDGVTTPARFLVSFLSGPVDPARRHAMDDADITPDQFAVRDRQAYLLYADGIATSRLTKVDWERRLGVIGTARNWTTVTRLLDLADVS